MKKTVFNEKHKAHGARMVPFAGFEMPVQFEGVNAEHMSVREKVGVFDVSHMGEFWFRGPKAKELMQKITVNDVNKLVDGQVQYTCMPNDGNGIVDDTLIYRFAEDKWMMVPNASNIDKDWSWVNKQNTEGANLENASDDIAQLAVQGPDSPKVMDKLVDFDIADIKFFRFKVVKIGSCENVILSQTGYTGSKGFELYLPNKYGEEIWDLVFEAGEEFDIKPVGLAARDTLRLEAGLCLYGNDITDTTTPIEASLGWITKFTDGNDFINREKLKKQKEEGVSRKLKGFEMIDKGIPRQHYEICDEQGNIIGEVTSGTMAPYVKKAIGMGYVKKEYAKVDTEIYIRIRKKLAKAKIVKIPFYKG
ncbi:MAG: glycine cleavage system aminomethyltransferase GcvT [Bacteroidales bacterium]|nr:glycine cleavage system aminomethyltransferase GcvT [Bacteroidales bacterium]